MPRVFKYHPETKLLSQYNDGTLPAGLDLAVATHLELCDPCRQMAARISNSLADNTLAQSASEQSVPITEDSSDRVFEMFGQQVQLPPSIAKLAQSGLQWKEVTKGGFTALLKGDGGVRCALLHMQAGCVVPRHTHTVTETMQMLHGRLCDDYDCYGATDFVRRDSRHEHALMSQEGSFCLMVVDGPIYFTQGWARLRNPLITLRHFHALVRKYLGR